VFGVETATMWMVPRDCPSQDALVGCQGSRALPFSVSLISSRTSCYQIREEFSRWARSSLAVERLRKYWSESASSCSTYHLIPLTRIRSVLLQEAGDRVRICIGAR
jgi:hypothetical protein